MQNEQGLLRRTSSDVSVEMIGKYKRELEIFSSSSKINNLSTIDEVKLAECECCEMKEECTQAYIAKVEDYFSGKWVCGLCSEAVKERMTRSAQRSVAMEEALSLPHPLHLSLPSSSAALSLPRLVAPPPQRRLLLLLRRGTSSSSKQCRRLLLLFSAATPTPPLLGGNSYSSSSRRLLLLLRRGTSSSSKQRRLLLLLFSAATPPPPPPPPLLGARHLLLLFSAAPPPPPGEFSVGGGVELFGNTQT
ncbi:hypothetical protein ACLB2K_018737 [Fragaria x ananassa]